MSTQKKHTTTLIDSKRKRAADVTQHPLELSSGAQDMLMFTYLTRLVSGLVWYVDPSDGVVVLDLTVLIMQSLGKTKSATKQIIQLQKIQSLENQTLRKFRAEGAGGRAKPVMTFTNAWEFLISRKGEIPQKLRAFSSRMIARIAGGDRTLAAEITERAATLDPNVRAVFMAGVPTDDSTIPLAPPDASTTTPLPSTAKRHKGDTDLIKIGADSEPLEYLAKRYAMVPAQANEAPTFQTLMHFLNIGVCAEKLLALVQLVNEQRLEMQEKAMALAHKQEIAVMRQASDDTVMKLRETRRTDAQLRAHVKEDFVGKMKEKRLDAKNQKQAGEMRAEADKRAAEVAAAADKRAAEVAAAADKRAAEAAAVAAVAVAAKWAADDRAAAAAAAADDRAAAAATAADDRAAAVVAAAVAAKVSDDLRTAAEAAKIHDREMAKLVFASDAKEKSVREANMGVKKAFRKEFNRSTKGTPFEHSLVSRCNKCDAYNAHFHSCDVFVPTDRARKPKVVCRTCSTPSHRAKHLAGTWMKRPVRDLQRDLTWIRECGLRNQGLCRSCEEGVDYMSFNAAHNVAASHGGPRSVENLRVSCFVCNNASGVEVFDKYAALERGVEVEDLPEMRDLDEAREIVRVAYEGKEVVPVHLLTEIECLYPGRKMVLNWIAQPPAFKAPAM
jgi:5-methylcytosine-specific restriction endonuclease McrA